MVITSSTRNRVGGNTPRGFESHLLRQNNSHPFGWLLFFAPKVGFERRLLETCQWHVSTAVGARRPTTSKIFNGCSPQRKESHRPDRSARSIRRDGRIWVVCMSCLRNISAKKFCRPTEFPEGRQFFMPPKAEDKVRESVDFHLF